MKFSKTTIYIAAAIAYLSDGPSVWCFYGDKVMTLHQLNWIKATTLILLLTGQLARCEESPSARNATSDIEYTDEQLQALNTAFNLSTRAKEVLSSGDIVYARELAERAANLVAETVGEHTVDHAICHNLVVKIDGIEERFDRIEETLEAFLEPSKNWTASQKTSEAQVMVLGNLAAAKHRLRKYEDSIRIYLTLIQRCNAEGREVDAAHLEIGLGQCYMDMQPPQMQSSLEHINLGLKGFADAQLPLGDERRAAAVAAIARHTSLSGEHMKALTLYDMALTELLVKPQSCRSLAHAALLYRYAEAQEKAALLAAAKAMRSDARSIRLEILGEDHPLCRETDIEPRIAKH